MVFSSLQFLFLFLPVTLAAYYIVPKSWRNTLLSIASLLFYIWGGGAFVFILIGSSLVDYTAGRLVARYSAEGNERGRKLALLASLVLNLGSLGYFKYSNWIVGQLNDVAAHFGWGQIAWHNVALPIGISFFTFQSMSYTLDIARGRVEPMKSFKDFLLYVTLFPQLIAGPIVRYHELADQLVNRTATVDSFSAGAVRFAHGLFKKVVIADSIGSISDAAFSLGPDQLNTPTAWIGVLAFSMQIYFDFSGYADMAIGLGLCFGFRFPENVLRPLASISITDFWRRWHITLSAWFRDYVFIPLGGSKGTPARRMFNLFFVYILVGIWHGANWTFVAFGVFHATFLVVEAATGQNVSDPSQVRFVAVRRVFYVLVIVMSLTLFRATNLSQAFDMFSNMFSFHNGAIPAAVKLTMTTRNVVLLIFAWSTWFLPPRFSTGVWLASARGPRVAVARAAVLGIALPYAGMLVATGSFQPFLYFAF